MVLIQECFGPTFFGLKKEHKIPRWLLPVRFWSVHMIRYDPNKDIAYDGWTLLLSHEATGGVLW